MHVSQTANQPGGEPERAEPSLPGTARVEPRPAPTSRIDPRALTVWRIHGAITAFVVTLAGAGGITGLRLMDVTGPFPIVAGIALIAIDAILIWAIPAIRWRRWRYAVRDAEIDLQRGAFIITRTLIPMTRVQHVDTRQGPIVRRYGLAGVVVATAAGSHEIPALAVDIADALRDRIAELAGVAEDV